MKHSFNKLIEVDEIDNDSLKHFCKFLYLNENNTIDLKKSIFCVVHKKISTKDFILEDTPVNLQKIRIILTCAILFRNFNIDMSSNLSVLNYWMSFDGAKILEFVYAHTTSHNYKLDEDISDDIKKIFEKLRFQSLNNLCFLWFNQVSVKD